MNKVSQRSHRRVGSLDSNTYQSRKESEVQRSIPCQINSRRTDSNRMSLDDNMMLRRPEEKENSCPNKQSSRASNINISQGQIQDKNKQVDWVLAIYDFQAQKVLTEPLTRASIRVRAPLSLCARALP